MKATPALPFAMALALLLMLGCGSTPDKRGSGSSSDSILEPRGREASRNDTSVVSLLEGICGMEYGEAMQVDDYRERLQMDWEGFSEAFSGANAVFSEDEEGYCSAKAANFVNESLMFFLMVLDPANDVVSAARFDSESGEATTWTEEEGGEIPKVVEDWIKELKSAPPEP